MTRKIIESKEQLIDLLRDLQTGDFENDTASSYVEALAGWLADCDGYYQSIGESRRTETADWQLIADALCAATIYE